MGNNKVLLSGSKYEKREMVNAVLYLVKKTRKANGRNERTKSEHSNRYYG